MDKTKKYTIIFIVICFIGIGVAGLSNQTSSSTSQIKSLAETNKQQKDIVSIQENKEDTNKEDQQDSKKEQSQSEEKTSEEKDDSQTEKTKQSEEKSDKTSKQSQSQSNKKSSKQSSSTSSTSGQSQKQSSSTKTESKKEESVSKPKQEVVQETPQSHVSISIQDLNGIVASETIGINDNNTVYDVLKTLCNQKGISLSTKGYGKYIYISSINGLSEFDYGNMSGWKYKVNGVYPNVGAGAYSLKDGDRVEWIYTTEG